MQRADAAVETAPIEAVAVIVPAHDEAAVVGAAMQSLSRSAQQSAVPVTAVMVLDSCSDDTGAIVRSHIRTDRSIEWLYVSTRCRRASSSRDAGLTTIAEHLQGRCPTSRVAVLSTDADSVVPTDWIVDHIGRLDAGADAVAGVVDLASESNELCYERWRAEYTTLFRADGTHPHVHCANLAVRLDVLGAAGGFGDLSRAEDIDLWRRMGALPTTRLRSDQTSVVRTSARLDGRVVGGFATALGQFRSSPPITGSAP